MSNIINPISWFELNVEDLVRAKAFYEAVVGSSLLPEFTDGSFQAYRFDGDFLMLDS